MALQHNDSYNESTFSFVNNINTPEGGIHLTGFKSAITKVFNDYARKIIFSDKDDNLSGDDLREGLAAIVSIKIRILSSKVKQSRSLVIQRQDLQLRVTCN